MDAIDANDIINRRGTQFIHRDYVNEIRVHSTSWEITHPSIFKQLVSKRPKQWHFISPEESQVLGDLYYTVLKQQTPFGIADIWVCCEHPSMFQFPKLPYSLETLWQWWLQWSQAPILISCPIIYNSNAYEYISWSVRSKPVVFTSFEPVSDWKLSNLKFFLMNGCYTIASGQTLIMALHRGMCIHTYLLVELFQKWKAYSLLNSNSDDNDNDNDNLQSELIWAMNFNVKTVQMLQYVHTNTLIGDYLTLYAMYGNTSPIVISYLLEQNISLTPLFSHVIEDSNHQVLLSAVFESYYSRLLSAQLNRKNPLWYSYWSVVKPYLSQMSLMVLRESPMYEKPSYIYAPENDFYNNVMDIYLYLTDKRHLLSYLSFIQSEYTMGDNRLVYYLFAATFKGRASKNQLYDYWSFIRAEYFDTKDEWMRWVCRLMVYYYKHPTIAISWRFFHWLFTDHPVFSVSLFENYPVLFCNEIYRRSLYTYFDLFERRTVPYNIPYAYKRRVLIPRIQSRLRILYKLKRSVPRDISHAFEEYLERHRDLLWQ